MVFNYLMLNKILKEQLSPGQHPTTYEVLGTGFCYRAKGFIFSPRYYFSSNILQLFFTYCKSVLGDLIVIFCFFHCGTLFRRTITMQTIGSQQLIITISSFSFLLYFLQRQLYLFPSLSKHTSYFLRSKRFGSQLKSVKIMFNLLRYVGDYPIFGSFIITLTQDLQMRWLFYSSPFKYLFHSNKLTFII